MTQTDYSYGQLGPYELEGEKCYGLYVELKGRPVFVDIREDELLEERKRKAQFLHENVIELERSVDAFLSENPKFRTRTLSSIGLHSPDIDRGEVFWDPDGTCILKGLRFLAV